ncbi:MAG: toprim domain-containing protein [Clostridia bacterium]|nr:toprim domain-containing protein [Clostridia bacterium]
MNVSKDQIERARQVDLVTYLKAFEPDNLVKISKGTYSTVEHDSLKISNGMWHWFSHHIGGKGALDYLLKVKAFSFVQAVNLLSACPVTEAYREENDRKEEFELPELKEGIKEVKSYLMKRGIDKHLIEFCHNKRLLFEDAEHHNCLFIGQDSNGVPRYGTLRSIRTDFKRELFGSDKRYSFRLTLNNAKTVHVFESPIDLLSFVTLEIKKHRDWKCDDYLSLGGVYKAENKEDVPLALQKYLEDNPDAKTICLHLDNDEIGRAASQQIIEALSDEYEVLDKPPPYGKDFNEYLQKEIQMRKEIER